MLNEPVLIPDGDGYRVRVDDWTGRILETPCGWWAHHRVGGRDGPALGPYRSATAAVRVLVNYLRTGWALDPRRSDRAD